MRLENARIVIIDDQQDLVEDLIDILEGEGASVRHAQSGAQGLAVAREAFDVALLDVRLPDALGVNLLPELKSTCNGCEVLMVTGHRSLDDAIQALDGGAYAYVLKPFHPEELIASVERALRQVRSTRERSALQATLQQERAAIAAVLDTAGALVVVLDRDGAIVRFNGACEQTTGWSSDEVVGRKVWDLLIPDEEIDLVRLVFERLVAGSFPSRFENHWRSKDGRKALIEWSNTVLLDSDGEAEWIVATGVDITERKKAETELRRALDQLAAANQRIRDEQAKVLQAEKLSSIGLLAAGVAHEVNNPLGGVMGCVQALRRGGLAAEREKLYLDAITDGLDRIKSTVKSLLDYARQRTPRPTDLDVAHLVEQTVRVVSPEFNRQKLELVTDLASGQRVYADRAQLMQVLVNIALNAAHASPDGATVRISTRRGKGRTGIAVDDEGPGIPQEIRDRVCDPFFTTKAEGEGTGLGLSITLGIVRAHGGDLEIDDRPGGGTRVTVWLPIEDESAED